MEGRKTLKFLINDNDGVTHTITITNDVHIPYLPMVLVSPQNWAQQTSDGTGGKNTILSFRGYRKTIPYSMQSNTLRFCSPSGTLRYQYFAAILEHGSTASKNLLRSKHVVTDNETSS